jgi:carbon-monoxide dehydrogenase large subunit
LSVPVSPRLFGARVKRVEDPRLLRGAGHFLADLKRPEMLHAAFLRSPHAHARILRVDLAEVRALPGVHLALEGREALTLARPFRVPLRQERYRPTDFPHLAVEKVRFVGEPLAMVVADDPYLARDALELIGLEFEPLPAATDVERAIEPGAPQLHAEAPNNVLFEHCHASGDAEAAFAAAEVVIGETFRNGRCAGLAMENRGVLAEVGPALVSCDAGGPTTQHSAVSTQRSLMVWSSTQAPFAVRSALAATLGLDEAAIKVMAPDIGGGFGVKAQVYAEEMLVPLAARLLGRAVIWAGDRLEDLHSSTQARDQVVRAELAARRDGTITALRAEILCDVGAYGVYPYGPALEALTTPGLLPGPYRIESYAYRSRAVATNKAPEGAYRGVGMVVAALVHERLLDLLAAELRLDPAEVRRRNFIPPEAFPYRSAGGLLYDSGSFGASLERALAAADYPALRREQAAKRPAGRRLGIGLGCYVEFTGMGSSVFRARGMELVDGREGTSLVVGPDGRVRAASSTPGLGQGLATSFAQVVADELGLPLEQVEVEATDTDTAPFGSGTFGSRAAVIVGSAARLACDELKERARTLAAGLLEASPDDLVFERGAVAVRGAPERRVTLAELAAQTGRLGQPPLAVRRQYDPPGATFSNATHLAVVEVDPETGLVAVRRYVVAEDCGQIINPMIADGQVHGAVAQGVGGALFEELRYDDHGQLETGTLMDYLVPGPAEMPTVEIHHLASPAPHSLLGVKGVGEGGTIGAVPAIANAVADALGVPVNQLPMTPGRVRQICRGAGRRAQPERAR